MAGEFTPYTTASPLFSGARPTWIPSELDIQRIMAYQAYEEVYWNVPDVFKISLRGTNELPIYIPSGRTIVDTTNRYVAPRFGLTTMDAETGTPSTDSQAAMVQLEQFMRRERFRSKFNGNKRYGLIRGDALWHITADDTKPEGTRLSVTAIDPAMYFPITADDDVDEITGVHLIETLTTPDGPRIRRLTYRKVPRSDGLNTITMELGIFELDKWAGPEHRPVEVLLPPTELPPQITQVPVYHWRNFDEPGNPYGSSELRGLERIMGAINQTVSDEDLALALEGIGMYATDSSEPIDPRTRQPVPWMLGPGRVVHFDGTKFDRVNGVGNLGDSYGEHFNRLVRAIREASSTPDIAVGQVDVTAVQSGVALSIQLGPMLSKADEKNTLLVDTHNQMFFDLLNMWGAAYEGWSFDGVMVSCVTGDAVPVDRAARFAELNDMLDRGVIDTGYYRVEAAKLGYVFPDTIGATATAEFNARNADAIGQRLTDEEADGGAA